MPAPIEIEVLLAFWYDPDAELRPWRPNQREFIEELIDRGILFRDALARGRKITANIDALAPYIDAVTSIPLPTHKFVWVVE